MDVPSPEPPSETEATDRFPLLMAQKENHCDCEHVVDISRRDDALSSLSNEDPPPGAEPPQHEDRSSSSIQAVTYQSPVLSSSTVNSRNSPSIRRSEGYASRRRSPLNSGLWISIELGVNVGQIIASIVVLSLSRHENPQAPLFAWVLGYASGCVAMLPIIYWRYRNRNQGTAQDTTHLHQGSSQNNSSSEPASYTAISVAQSSGEENHQIANAAASSSQITQSLRARLNSLVDHFKMALDCFFAVWFVVGNVWIFGGHSSPSDAPKLYRLCIVFLTFSCIGYAMPFILCATICCCLPCMISILGIQEDLSQTKGASMESINALPTYKFKLKKRGDNQDINSGTCEGGVLAAGTEKERTISGEDAVCCICLAKYVDNEELRELSCSHFFHIDCVDKWLKINALCPLCKCEIGENGGASSSTTNSSQHQSEQRAGNVSAEGVYGINVF
ncbi:unnamed protein product [Ilex paraguariensis]|uniref:RING-type domain-containing protein n=1 Tax=Ilex paraguariensis TaxID=185542 RepID=A0ABC8SJQ0_9AQUA